ncbi:MAG: hypothetical protein ACE149_16520 [Armatimonadota bacterium]
MQTDLSVQFKVRTTVEKYEGPVEGEPYERRVVLGNLGLREGILALFNLLTGNTEDAFSEANACIGVGDSGAVAADTQTGLQAATNKAYVGMDTGYPVVGALADKKVTFRATFDGDTANFAWEEITVANGNSDSADNLNRKVESLGTKSAGNSWVVTVEISAA